jgi:sugar phosphate isomerase/epimerase
MTARRVSLSHLTLIDVPAPDLVQVAADTGYDGVGLRILPVTGGPDHTLRPGSLRLRETLRAMAATGVPVLDVEVLKIQPGTNVAEYQAFLDVAAELGARYAIAVVEDPVASRAADTLARLCALAAGRGVTVMLEFMVFKAIGTLDAATRLIRAAAAPNAGVLVDALHLARSGGTVEQVRRLPPQLIPYLQVCDAASVLPADDVAAAGEEARRSRLLPGEGALPLAGLLAASPAEAWLSMEIPDGWHNPDPRARALAVRRSVDRLWT